MKFLKISPELEEQINKYIAQEHETPSRIETWNVENNEIVFIWANDDFNKQVELSISQDLESNWYIQLEAWHREVWAKDFEPEGLKEALDWLWEEEDD